MDSEKYNAITFVISRYDTYFNLANIKASLLITTNAVLLGVAISSYIALLEKYPLIAGSWYIKSGMTASIALIIISCFFSLKVIFSFLSSGNRTADYHSLVFFGSVCEMKRKTFITKFKEQTASELLTDLSEQAHILSCGLHEKYKNLNRSTIFCGLSILLPSSMSILIYWVT